MERGRGREGRLTTGDSVTQVQLEGSLARVVTDRWMDGPRRRAKNSLWEGRPADAGNTLH